MVNICELSINVVIGDKPKTLIGLGQKASGQVQGLSRFPDADVAPPADRQHLTHLMVCKWNVVSP